MSKYIAHTFIIACILIGSQIVASSNEPTWGKVTYEKGHDKKKGTWERYKAKSVRPKKSKHEDTPTHEKWTCEVSVNRKTKQYRGVIKEPRCPIRHLQKDKAMDLFELLEAEYILQPKKQDNESSDEISDIE